MLLVNGDKPTHLRCKCRGTFQKVISPSTFILKGTGWYATDYAKKGNKFDTDPGRSSKPRPLKDDNKKKEQKNG
jgi:predicted nucleic acid-binding Zn ribbon protein